MIERMIVPLDGSLTAEAVLPHVRRLLYRKDSEVILVRAVVPPPVENSMMVAEAGLGAAREYLLGKKEALDRAGARVKAVVRVGSPLGVILDVAEEEKATLIAIATHGATGLSRLLMGSVAEILLRKTPIPVLAVRPFWSYDLAPIGGAEFRPIRNILYTLDGSDRSAEALPGVLELAELFESKIVLLRVLEAKKGKPASQAECEDAEAQLKSLSAMIEKKGVETSRLLEAGDPVEQILKATKAHDIDLLAMTTHGRGGLSRAILGSVTEEVLRQASVPLLVTRNAAVKPQAKTSKTAKAESGGRGGSRSR
jgi:nucleotide-binding universal stress UspA family protein